jgi:hypothetical protein
MVAMPEPVPPLIAAEIAALLDGAGWTVRRLREAGFAGQPAAKLLGKQGGTYSIETADKALALVGRRLSHARIKRRPKP